VRLPAPSLFVLQHFAFLSIGVDYFQILAMFGNANVPWPPAILTLFRIMSSFSFNLDITAPECSMPNLSYPTKWCVLWGPGPAVCVCTHNALAITRITHDLEEEFLGRELCRAWRSPSYLCAWAAASQSLELLPWRCVPSGVAFVAVERCPHSP
jgi:hypothetical protein